MTLTFLCHLQLQKGKCLSKKAIILISKEAAFCLITVTKSDIMGSSAFTWVWLCCNECVHFPEVGLMFPTRSNYSSLVDSVLSICIKADPHLMGWLQWTRKDRLINKQINIVPTPKYSSIRNTMDIKCAQNLWRPAVLQNPMLFCCLNLA